MKIIYYSQPFFADCDFPLVKALQEKGVDVRYYMPMNHNFQRSNIIELKRPLKKWGIIKGSELEDLQVYKDCIDLQRLYIIAGSRSKKWWPFTWLLWIWAFIHMLLQHADILHIVWQLCGFEKILHLLPFNGRKVMTVHDPIQHPNVPRFMEWEAARIKCFQWADRFVLLNKNQVDLFIQKYAIKEDDIRFSRLGIYDSISYIVPQSCDVTGEYILFFGQISPYKGLEYLLKAMVEIHKKFPQLKLVVAGGGALYFDDMPYRNLDYVEWRHRFISVSELAGLIRNCKFSVCPYTSATQSGVIQTAFALGSPVIATNVGALAAAVQNEVTGLVIPPSDVCALEKSIIRLLSDCELLGQIRDNVSKFHAEMCSWNPISEDYISIYNELIYSKSSC